ncbi:MULTISPECIES: TetR/AcrR family transcriptional regulator [Achromobacter]|uniref:TetR/AcrR family transcriptional regulator n=1 Tax=Achromobacter TaxID=222 RepID=UPI0006FE36B9|nr:MULTISPECIES: TetR/AcrR family transcriptional regulator [Achromobacter]KRB09184.1 TetR family transcriptional regulator [Achromobacter sp. Root170]MCP2518173.1 TetR/AcrR family transcriptional regulator [Achromobacter mucicolens]MCU6619895.1 TetR/AcrR family transcriptional regulator [Achromobacter mucicolens]MDH1525537.1 TetR/AcrR family transcriptional regulator [Achromobacter mucicolens]WGJ91078.1 TetR/AcrR family transcriptional regulator [Achromobacter mucicolens]
MALTAPPVQKRARAGRPPTLAAPRERILEEAAKLFARSGYDGSSISDLAAAIGVSKAAIYHYYPTKQDIYDAIILQVLEGLTQTVGRDVAGAVGGVARLRAFMVGHARYFEQHHAQFVTMLIGYSGMALSEREDAARLRDSYEKLLRDVIAQGVADGAFRALDVAATGRAVLSMLNWMVRWYKPGQGDSAETIADGYFDLLVGGMRP